MTWLKRNLFLVAGGLVALGMLGFAVFFLFTKKQAVDEVTGQLTAKTDELKTLTTADPYPNQENIEAAKKEQVKLANHLQGMRRYFVPVASYTNMDSAAFKVSLQTTISDMEHDAEKAGVALPNAGAGSGGYDFTFKPQRTSVVFAPETLVPLAMQVAEIQAMCDILFNARIENLLSLRRTPVAKEDEGAADYLFGRKPVTNAVTGAVLMPYEITFQGFSGELAAVLDGFNRSSNCFIVKNIDVQTNVVQAAAESTPTYMPYTMMAPSAAAPTPQMSPRDLMMMRYGLRGSRYGRPPVTEAPAAPAPTPGTFTPPVRRGPETILDERPFKVTMYVEAVRLLDRPKAKAAK